jgi:hypothetical protein
MEKLIKGTVILGPLMGVFTADYYLVRKQKVKLSDLYHPSPRGIYYFTHGINFRAYVAWILGWAPTIGGMASVDPANSVPQGLVETYYTGFITGYVISFLAHWGLNVVFPPVGLGEVDEYDSVSQVLRVFIVSETEYFLTGRFSLGRLRLRRLPSWGLSQIWVRAGTRPLSVNFSMKRMSLLGRGRFEKEMCAS